MKRMMFMVIFCVCSILPSFAESKIIFWKYNSEITFEKLSSFQLSDAYHNMEVAFEIPLDKFCLYFWDEQVLRMDSNIFVENNYSDKFMQINLNSDYGSIYFSVVVHDEIVQNGLNRVITLSARMMPYDNSLHPRITMWARNNDYVFFRFTYRPILVHLSIWDISEEFGDVRLLFINEIFHYFESLERIQRGKLNISRFREEEQLRMIPF